MRTLYVRGQEDLRVEVLDEEDEGFTVLVNRNVNGQDRTSVRTISRELLGLCLGAGYLFERMAEEPLSGRAGEPSRERDRIAIPA